MVFIFFLSITCYYKDVFKSNNANRINNYDEYCKAIKKAMSSYDDSVTLELSKFDKNMYNLEAVNKVAQDTPELMGIYAGSSYIVKHGTTVSVTINFKYKDSKENMQSKEKATQQKVQEIVDKVVKPNMKDYEKEAALHDYVVNNSQFDKRFYSGNMPYESYTAYGVLVNGTGVCQGYAEAMYRLFKSAGIESVMALGEAYTDGKWTNHTWNIVKIGGQYYNLDATWDDPVADDGTNILRYSYFNITDEQLAKNHKWNKGSYPECTSTEFSFNNLNWVEKDNDGNKIEVIKNNDELFRCIKNSLANKKPSVSVKILNYDKNAYDMASTVNKAYNALSKGGSYAWSQYKDEISNSEYITFTFK